MLLLPLFLTGELTSPSAVPVPPPRISSPHFAAPSTSPPASRPQCLFCSLLELMKSTDPLLLNETELKLAARHCEKSTFTQVIQKLKIIPGYLGLETRVSTSSSWLQSPGMG